MQELLVVVLTAAALLVPGGALLGALGGGRLVPSGWLAVPVAACLSLLLLSVALVATFLLRGSIRMVVWMLVAATVLSLVGWLGQRTLLTLRRPDAASLVVLAAAACGAVVGGAVQGGLFSDTLYHLAQAIKIAELDRIGFNNTLQFEFGSAHPGYLVPTFQALLALPSTVLEPLRVALLLPVVTVPLGVLAAAGMGHVVVGTRRAGAVAAWAWLAVALVGAAPAFRPATLATYGGVFVLEVVVPVTVALVVAALRAPSRRLLLLVAATTVLVGILHVSYLVHLAMPMLALVLGWTWTRASGVGWRRMLLVLGSVAAASVLVAAALLPRLLELQTFLQDASNVQLPGEGAVQRLHADRVRELLVGPGERFRLHGQATAYAGGSTLAAIVACIVGGLAWRRRPAGWLVLGSTALVLLAVSWAPAFTHLSAAMGIDQARRLGEALPLVLGVACLAEWLAGCLARARPRRGRQLLVALGAALGAAATALAVVRVPSVAAGADVSLVDAWTIGLAWAAGLSVAALLALRPLGWARRRLDRGPQLGSIRISAADDPDPGPGPSRPWSAGLVAALPVAALVVAAFVAAWPSLQDRSRAREAGLARGELEWVGPRERRALRRIPTGSLVLADVRRRTSYRIMAIAPVYVLGAPPGHVANTPRNAITMRVRRTNRLLEGQIDPDRRRELLRAWRVDWVVLRTLPRYADDLAAMRGPLADEWEQVSATDQLATFRRIRR